MLRIMHLALAITFGAMLALSSVNVAYADKMAKKEVTKTTPGIVKIITWPIRTIGKILTGGQAGKKG